MRLAVDAMGGDYAPREIVRGVVDALDVLSDEHQFVLLGIEEMVRACLAECELETNPGRDRIEVVHCPEVVEMNESPVAALRHKRHSSVAEMVKLAAEDGVDAIISAGNTGAFVAACQMKVRPLPGVSRPGIVVALPTFHGPIAICDVGANIAPKDHHLHQYAIMASRYAEKVLGTANPRVALLNIGSEDAKGNRQVRRVGAVLKGDDSINFVGNVEGREIYHGAADAVVCDGFLGNVVLKLTEGLSEGLIRTLSREITESAPELADPFARAIDAVQKKHDYSEYGGAPLLGVDTVCLVCHGRSNANAIKNALLRAAEFTQHGLNEAISESCMAREETPA